MGHARGRELRDLLHHPVESSRSGPTGTRPPAHTDQPARVPRRAAARRVVPHGRVRARAQRRARRAVAPAAGGRGDAHAGTRHVRGDAADEPRPARGQRLRRLRRRLAHAPREPRDLGRGVRPAGRHGEAARGQHGHAVPRHRSHHRHRRHHLGGAHVVPRRRRGPRGRAHAVGVGQLVRRLVRTAGPQPVCDPCGARSRPRPWASTRWSGACSACPPGRR